MKVNSDLINNRQQAYIHMRKGPTISKANIVKVKYSWRGAVIRLNGVMGD